MSGYGMLLLLQADSEEDAISTADGIIDGWWEDGTLVEGDRGYVGVKEAPEGDWEVRSAKDDPAGFVARLRELNNERTAEANGYLRQALEDCLKAGGKDFLDIVPEESSNRDMGMAGYSLHIAGAVVAGYWTKHALVWDVDAYQGGVYEARIAEVEKAPDRWWLVEVCVG